LAKDVIREGASRLGVMVQVYSGPKILQILDESPRDLPQSDVQLANEARAVLAKAFPTLKIKAELPVITAPPDPPDSAKRRLFHSLMHLHIEPEKRLGDIFGGNPPRVFHFAWIAAYYVLQQRFVPHREREIQVSKQSLSVSGGLAGLPESQIQAFISNPKVGWGTTFDLLVEVKKSWLDRFSSPPRGLKFDVPGAVTDDLIRRWLALR
jgi:hypothetical protein